MPEVKSNQKDTSRILSNKLALLQANSLITSPDLPPSRPVWEPNKMDQLEHFVREIVKINLLAQIRVLDQTKNLNQLQLPENREPGRSS